MKGDSKKIIKILTNGGTIVALTDTIYGILGSALNKKTVEKIYKIRKRSLQKPFIILIGSLSNLDIFNITLDEKTKKILKKSWPGKVSIILPCPGSKLRYLHRTTESLAFRLPKNKKLIQLLKKTGPLVAPSANPEGFPPANTIEEASKYFGKKIDLYVDGGKIKSSPSKLIRIKGGKIEILR